MTKKVRTRVQRLALFGLGALASFPALCSAEPTTIDPLKTEITLERSACYGTCPAYKVTIHGNGQVEFETDSAPVDSVDALHRRFAQSDGVLLPGIHEDKIAPQAVAALIRQFQTAHFWKFKTAYRTQITDSPTYILTIDDGNSKKSVTDYVGEQSGMPHAITELEDAVDQVAGSDRWISGSPALIPWLERSGFDFHSAHATELAVAAEMRNAAEETVSALIARGAPLSLTPTIVGSSQLSPIAKQDAAGEILLESAIGRGHAAVFKTLAADGWLARLGKAQAAVLFAQGAGGCSPAMVDAAADAGVDIDLAAPRKDDADPSEPQGKTALAELATSYACQSNEAERVRTAERLIARGANPNHRDSLGRTPLFGVENLALLNLLLAHGSDATAKSNDGQSMVFGSWTDAIVLALLEAGASPVGFYDIDGKKTLAQQAKDRKMPQVARWLKSHPDSFCVKRY